MYGQGELARLAKVHPDQNLLPVTPEQLGHVNLGTRTLPDGRSIGPRRNFEFTTVGCVVVGPNGAFLLVEDVENLPDSFESVVEITSIDDDPVVLQLFSAASMPSGSASPTKVRCQGKLLDVGGAHGGPVLVVSSAWKASDKEDVWLRNEASAAVV